MTHKYYYIEAGNILDETSRIYIVNIGTTEQAHRDFQWLTDFSVEHGHFFQLCNVNVVQFVSKVRYSVKNLQHPISINARALVKHFKMNTRPVLSAVQLSNVRMTLKYLNDNYRTAYPVRKSM